MLPVCVCVCVWELLPALNYQGRSLWVFCLCFCYCFISSSLTLLHICNIQCIYYLPLYSLSFPSYPTPTTLSPNPNCPHRTQRFTPTHLTLTQLLLPLPQISVKWGWARRIPGLDTSRYQDESACIPLHTCPLTQPPIWGEFIQVPLSPTHPVPPCSLICLTFKSLFSLPFLHFVFLFG